MSQQRIGPRPDNASAALRYLIQHGMKREDAAALVWNFQQESGRNLDTMLSHDGGTGYGIAGFRDPSPGHGRRTDLINFARSQGRDPADLYTQLDFAQHELAGPERGAYARIQAASTPEAKAAAAISYFRPYAPYAADRARRSREVYGLLRQDDASPATVASNFAPPAAPAPGAVAPRVPGDLPPLPSRRPTPQPGSIASQFASSDVSDPMSMPPSGSLGGPSPFTQPSAPPAPASEPVVASVAPSTTPAPMSAGGLGANIGSLLAGLFQPQQDQPQQPQRNPALAAALFAPPEEGTSSREAEAEAIMRRRRLAAGGAQPVLANLFAA